MTRGYPDFGVSEARGRTLTPADLAELAARLGGISTFDRRGRVLGYDDFEAPVLKWTVSVGSGASAVLDSTSVKSGAQACKLTIPNSATVTANIAKRRLPPLVTNVGAEISFSVLNTNCFLYLQLDYYDGTNQWQARLRIHGNAATIEIQKDDATYEEVADYTSLQQTNHHYYPIKLVADFVSKKYKRIVFATDDIDVSSYSLKSSVSSLAPHFKENIQLAARASTGGSVWIDDEIFTYDEP